MKNLYLSNIILKGNVIFKNKTNEAFRIKSWYKIYIYYIEYIIKYCITKENNKSIYKLFKIL